MVNHNFESMGDLADWANMVSHNFESMGDLADYIGYLAEQARNMAKSSKTQKDTHAYSHEAVSLEYIVDIIRTSNLMKARLILINDDLEDARNEIKDAIRQLTLIQEAIRFSKDNLQGKLDELVSGK